MMGDPTLSSSYALPSLFEPPLHLIVAINAAPDAMAERVRERRTQERQKQCHSYPRAEDRRKWLVQDRSVEYFDTKIIITER